MDLLHYQYVLYNPYDGRFNDSFFIVIFEITMDECWFLSIDSRWFIHHIISCQILKLVSAFILSLICSSLLSRMICCMITDLSLRSKNCWYHIFKELFRFHSTCGNPFSNLKVLFYNRYIHYISSDIIFEHSLYYFVPVFFRLDCGQTTVMEVYVQYSTTNSFIAGFRDPYLIS